MRTKHVFHAVDSHTEGMPTRVITGGVGVIPGATMAERRLWFIEHLDDLRTLLMYEPRGHAAMSGAILQPPTRPDADCGVLYIEVSGLLPMCGHGTIGVATVLVETGMVPVVEPVTTVRLDTPAGLVVAEVAVADGAAKAVTIRNVPQLRRAASAPRSRSPGYGTVAYDLAYGGNFYAIVDLEELGCRSTAAAKQRDHRRRPGHHGRAQRRGRAGAPDRTRRSAAATTSTWPRRARPPGTPGTRWRSTPAGSTARRAAPAPARAWPSCTRAASCRWTPTSSTSRYIGTRFIGRLVEADRGRRPPGRGADRHRPRLDHRHRAVLPRPDRSVPRGFPPVSLRRSQAKVRGTVQNVKGACE